MLLLLVMIFSPIIIGILIYAVDNVFFSRSVFLLQAGMTMMTGVLIKGFFDAGMVSWSVVAGNWASQIGVEFVVDRISVLFVLMTVIAFWYVYLYVWWSRKGDHKFLFFLSMLQGALVALFLANDLFTMFVLIEFITITCSILITYKKDGTSVKAGLYYLLYNSIAMLLFLLGLIFVYMQAGTLNITLIESGIGYHVSAMSYRWGIVLIVSAFCLKSAVFPVFSWLPLAHSAAPASVSALLSGLVVKTGLFILLRLGLVVFIPGVTQLLLILGLISGIFGAFMAFAQSDIKKVLAYHTISQVGLIIVGLSTGERVGEIGALLHVFNHFLFKSLLFLCAGTLITWTGHRGIAEIRGVIRKCPLLGWAMLTGILAITGAPFFNGSISKDLIYQSASGAVVQSLLVLINIGTILSFTKVAAILIGPDDGPSYPKDARIWSSVFLAACVLATYPVEAYLLSAVIPLPAQIKAVSPFVAVGKYFMTVGFAIGVYKLLYLPNRLLLKRLDSVRYSFKLGVGVFIVFVSVLSVILV